MGAGFSISKANAIVKSLGMPLTDVLASGEIKFTQAGQVIKIRQGVANIGLIMGALMISIHNNGTDLSKYTWDDIGSTLGIVGA